MARVHGLHGLHEPFAIFRAARPKGVRAEYPMLDDDEIEQGLMGLVERDNRFPDLEAVFWLIAPRGKGRHSVHVDGQGNVKPNLFRIRFGMGTAGVEPSKTNQRELDCSEFMREKLAQGLVRVDHLKDVHDERLGLPDDETWAGAESSRDWCWLLLEPSRIQQLAGELVESEEGRRLVDGWKPKIPSRIYRKLASTQHKSAGQIEAEAEIRATIDIYLTKAAARFHAAMHPLPPEPMKAPDKGAEKVVERQMAGAENATEKVGDKSSEKPTSTQK